MRRATPLILALTLATGCGGLLQTVRNFGPLGDNSCEAYAERGRGYSYDMHRNDWAPIAQLLATPVNAAADLLAARKAVRDAEVPIIYRKRGRGGTAAYWVILLPGDFEEWTKDKVGDELQAAIERQSTLLWHEYTHIVWEHRIGPQRSAAVYVDEAGTLAVEGTAYAVTFALNRRYGWSEARIDAAKVRRWKGFPERYLVAHAVDSLCVGRFMNWADQVFRDSISKNPPGS